MKKLLISLIFLSILNISSAQEISYVVTSLTANLRLEPSVKSKIIGTLKQGEIVGVTKVIDNPDWVFVTYYGNEGYMSSKLLTPLDEYAKYKNWNSLSAKTGDEYNCDNIHPEYDYAMDNSLMIICGNDADVVVKLMDLSDNCIRISYIKAGDTYTMKNIPLGTYYLKTAYGKDYRQSIENEQCKIKFLRNPIYKKGDQYLNFTKEYTGKTIEGSKEVSHYQLSYYKLELNIDMKSSLLPSKNNLKTSKISEKEFNQ
jgi:hypothetical protein